MLSYMDTDRFIIYVKTEDVHEDIVDDVEKSFDNQIMKSSDFCLQEKTKKVIGLIKMNLVGRL